MAVRLLIVSFIVILLDSCQGEVIITDLDGTTAIAQFRSMAASFGQSIPKGMFIILCTDKTYVYILHIMFYKKRFIRNGFWTSLIFEKNKKLD